MAFISYSNPKIPSCRLTGKVALTSMFVFDVIRNEMFVEMSLHKEGTCMGQGGEILNKSGKLHHTHSQPNVSISFTVVILSKRHRESESAEKTTRLLLSTVVLTVRFAHFYFSFLVLEMEK